MDISSLNLVARGSPTGSDGRVEYLGVPPRWAERRAQEVSISVPTPPPPFRRPPSRPQSAGPARREYQPVPRRAPPSRPSSAVTASGSAGWARREDDPRPGITLDEPLRQQQQPNHPNAMPQRHTYRRSIQPRPPASRAPVFGQTPPPAVRLASDRLAELSKPSHLGLQLGGSGGW